MPRPLDVTSPPRVLILLADRGDPRRDLTAATLAWMCDEAGVLFDAYYSGYSLGYHHGGGIGQARPGALNGSTVVGGRHHQHFLRVQAEMECVFLVLGDDETFPLPALVVNAEQILGYSEELLDLYSLAGAWLKVDLSGTALTVGLEHPGIPGLSAYSYPEIYFRKALAFPEPLSARAVGYLGSGEARSILTLWTSQDETVRLGRLGFEVSVLDVVSPSDDYGALTSRAAARWRSQGQGFFVGDPPLVSAWIPWLCAHRKLSLYSQPQLRVIAQMASALSESPDGVFGRQYEDADLLEMSKLGQPMELVDPNRPVLPVVAEQLRPVTPSTVPATMAGVFPTDDELRRYAVEGKVLASVIFWSGALREIETLQGVMDLVAITKLRAGVAVGARAFEHGSQAFLDLLYHPLEKGGVFPYLEPLLGSSGLGPSFEGYLGPDRLKACLRRAIEIIRERAGESFLPRGWYAVMDGQLERMDFARRLAQKMRVLRDWRIWYGRPYGNWRPKPVEPVLLRAVRECGFRYAVSKTSHGWPAVLHVDRDFIAINHTAGVWEGWSPFVDLRDIHDLLSAERRLVRRGQPGWLLSSFDTCLWTFSYHQWERGAELKEMAELLVSGGETGEMINVTPEIVARYARILADMGHVDRVLP